MFIAILLAHRRPLSSDRVSVRCVSWIEALDTHSLKKIKILEGIFYKEKTRNKLVAIYSHLLYQRLKMGQAHWKVRLETKVQNRPLKQNSTSFIKHMLFFLHPTIDFFQESIYYIIIPTNSLPLYLLYRSVAKNLTQYISDFRAT